jgi:hypothetical protein
MIEFDIVLENALVVLYLQVINVVFCVSSARIYRPELGSKNA